MREKVDQPRQLDLRGRYRGEARQLLQEESHARGDVSVAALPNCRTAALPQCRTATLPHYYGYHEYHGYHGSCTSGISRGSLNRSAAARQIATAPAR